MTDVRLKISPPWVTDINKIQALFDPDPQIACNVVWKGQPSITLAVAESNPKKAVAIRQLLPEYIPYSNVTLSIDVDCPKIINIAFTNKKELFEAAFGGNPAFAYCVAPKQEDYWYLDFVYVVFKNCVVQFFNDNLNDAHGLISTLYQDIAEELFRDAILPGGGMVAYCTDVERGALGKPLGEWP